MNAIGEGDEEDEDLFSEAKKVAPNEQRASATSVRSNRKPSPNSLIKLLGTKSKLDRSKMSVNGVHFAHLRHGNDDELTFNMQCQIIYLLIYFMEKTQCELHPENLDLVDVRGNIKNLRLSENKFKYGSTFLEPRETYILVDTRSFPKVVPLIQRSELLTDEFYEGLSQIKEIVVTPKTTAKKSISPANKSPDSSSDNLLARKKSKEDYLVKKDEPSKTKATKVKLKLGETKSKASKA